MDCVLLWNEELFVREFLKKANVFDDNYKCFELR